MLRRRMISAVLADQFKRFLILAANMDTATLATLLRL
jgi:hypothetical protein